MQEMREVMEANNVAGVKVVPAPKSAVLPVQRETEQPRAKADTREVVRTLVEESNSKDRAALHQVCDRIMGKVGL
jgi:hypothetical protein